jgi:hypothetical protein
MRRIFSDSTGPRVVLSEDGFFKELSTGTDSYAEHNCPEHHLEFQLLSRIRYEGEKPTDNDIFEGLRIAHGDKVQFRELGPDAKGLPQAVLGFIKHEERPGFISAKRSVDDERTLKELSAIYDDKDITAALAYGNFAIKVRGEQLVRALKHFYDAIQAGTVYLASGSRLNSKYGREFGLTMVNMAVLTDEERQQMPGHVVETVRRRKLMHLPG